MDCPRCGAAGGDDPACPRCGVIFAKLREPRPRPEPSGPPPPAPSRGGGALGWLAPIALLAVGLGAVLLMRHGLHPAAPPDTRAKAPRPDRAAELPVDVPPPSLAPAPTLSAAPIDAAPGIPDADIVAANTLARRVNTRTPLTATDVQAAEDLFARHPDSALRGLLGAVLMQAASAEQAQRRFAEAEGHYRRATEILARSSEPRLALMGLRLATEDWSGAESAARDVLALEPANLDALQGLAFALFRQDRSREAAEALRASLDVRDTPAARALLYRIEKGLADERGMTEQRISHFNVRYDGDAHDDVGREILRALERHYATLVTTLDAEPVATIPVILFSRAQYYGASGAPAWSGGAYDNLDGRIRIPIGGLTSSLTPDMDDVLIHEVTHAFIADRSHGTCPREIHEGLAQYMEGKRLASMLDADQLHALAEGRLRGVGGFYLESLSLVEYLMAIRGQGGMNDLLKAMGETGNVDEAFRRVYGQDYRSTQAAWVDWMSRRYGG